MTTPRPNILWLVLEDVSPWFGCYGHAHARTPRLDALAAEGLLYERAYATAPVCSPARSALITGRYAVESGAHHHTSHRTSLDAAPLPNGLRTLPERLRAAGYHCVNAGKDDYNFTYDRPDLYPGPYQTTFHAKVGPALRWDDLPRDQPFFAQIQLDGGKLRHDPAIAALAPAAADVSLPGGYPDDPAIRRIFTLHHAAIAATDRQVGDILDQLARHGLADNTVVMLFADHGMDGLRHKQFCYEGGLHVPLILRAPPGLGRRGRRADLVDHLDVAATTLALAGLPTARGRDLLAPSLPPVEALFAARDRCDFTLDGIRTARTERFRYIRNLHPDRPWMQPQYRSAWPEFTRWRDLAAAGVLTGAVARFASEARSSEELYDVLADPDCTRDLAAAPTHAAELTRHRALVDAWMDETRDPGATALTETDLLATLARWKEQCVDPAYAPIRTKHAALLARWPEERPGR